MFRNLSFVVSMIGAANCVNPPALALAFGLIGMVASIRFAVNMARS